MADRGLDQTGLGAWVGACLVVLAMAVLVVGMVLIGDGPVPQAAKLIIPALAGGLGAGGISLLIRSTRRRRSGRG